MPESFAHEALLSMDAHDDIRAPGGAITLGLCGGWEHEPPCPRAPHRTSAERAADNVRVRTLFVAEPGAEQAIRDRIDAALITGELRTPDGEIARWQLLSSHRSDVLEQEADAIRLLLNNGITHPD